jgi:hypothetical protein
MRTLAGGADVRNVDQGARKAVAVKDSAAAALHQGAGFLRWHTLACLPHRIFSIGPIPLIAPRLKICLRSARQKNPPSRFEVGAGLVERGSGAVSAFPWMTARVKPAMPAPRIFPGRHAGADRDRADADVAIVDVPAFVGGIGRAAAGELRHARHHSAVGGSRQIGP